MSGAMDVLSSGSDCPYIRGGYWRFFGFSFLGKVTTNLDEQMRGWQLLTRRR
jgi:hypothetical protein